MSLAKRHAAHTNIYQHVQSLLESFFLGVLVTCCVSDKKRICLSSFLGQRHFICRSLRSVSWQETCLSVSLLLGTYGAPRQDTCSFSMLFLVLFLPSIFLDLLVARSVSSQETLYMYKYMSTCTVSLDKIRFFLFLYLYTWYIRNLLTRHISLLIVYLFYVFCLLSIFLDLLVARSVSWQETLSMYTYISTYTASLVFLFLYLFTWYIQSLLTRHMFLLVVLKCVLSSVHLSRTTRCAKCLLARDTLYVQVHINLQGTLLSVSLSIY